MNAPLAELRAAQTRILEFLDWPDSDCRRQFHPDLSPAAWHVGHAAVVEAFWIREQVLGAPIDDGWKSIYFPELIAKSARAQQLPPSAVLRAFAQQLFSDNVDLLDSTPAAHPLLRDHYLAHFLLQHHSQHLEILAQIAQQRALAKALPYAVQTPLLPAGPAAPTVALSAGAVDIGSDDVRAYDNEMPAQRVTLAAFAIAAHPVTNAQYLGFMADGGYDTRAHWSDAGWDWRARAGYRAPHAWRQDAAGQWYTREDAAPSDLRPDAAVTGLSFYEAQAYARYANARLPHEHEWEHAVRAGVIDWKTVAAWEWCANAFFPYPRFKPFPYAGYSTPWFDGSHYSLRGASRVTAPCIRRASFRNFYTADKRHVFAGVRLAHS